MQTNPEQFEVLRDCAEKFDAIGISYMLTDSMALLYYAKPRFTADIDVVIEITPNDAEKIIKAFEIGYYVPENAVRQAVRQRSMFNLIQQEFIVKVDCVVRKDEAFQQLAFANRKKVNYFDFEVWIIGKEDLILSKLNWARASKSETQFLDIENLLRGETNEDYLNEWAQKLDLTDSLNDIYERLK